MYQVRILLQQNLPCLLMEQSNDHLGLMLRASWADLLLPGYKILKEMLHKAQSSSLTFFAGCFSAGFSTCKVTQSLAIECYIHMYIPTKLSMQSVHLTCTNLRDTIQIVRMSPIPMQH